MPRERPLLPIKDTLLETLARAWIQRRRLVDALWLPEAFILLCTVLGQPLGAAVRRAPETDAMLPQLALGLVLAVLSGALRITVAVATHRIVLLGDDETRRHRGFRFGAREWGFLRKLFWIGLICGLLSVPFVAGLGKGEDSAALDQAEIARWVVIMIVVSFVGTPLALALPAQAVDEPIELRQAWRLASGNVFRIAVLFGLPALAVQLLVWSLTAVMQTEGVGWGLVDGVTSAVLRFFDVVLLSVIYRTLIRADPSSRDPNFQPLAN